MQRFTRKKRAGWQMPKRVNCCTLACSDDNTLVTCWLGVSRKMSTVLLLAVRTLHDFYRRIGRNTSICIAFNKNELKYTSQRGWCAEVNKDGEEGISKENRRGVQNPQYRITRESIMARDEAGECPEQHTHTTPSVGWIEPKAKQGVLSFQFSFHFLYCYYSIEPR